MMMMADGYVVKICFKLSEYDYFPKYYMPVGLNTSTHKKRMVKGVQNHVANDSMPNNPARCKIEPSDHV